MTRLFYSAAQLRSQRQMNDGLHLRKEGKKWGDHSLKNALQILKRFHNLAQLYFYQSAYKPRSIKQPSA